MEIGQARLGYGRLSSIWFIITKPAVKEDVVDGNKDNPTNETLKKSLKIR